MEIRDQLVDYGLSSNEERRMIAQLAKEDHCDFLSDQIEKHRPKGKLKALAFLPQCNACAYDV